MRVLNQKVRWLFYKNYTFGLHPSEGRDQGHPHCNGEPRRQEAVLDPRLPSRARPAEAQALLRSVPVTTARSAGVQDVQGCARFARKMLANLLARKLMINKIR